METFKNPTSLQVYVTKFVSLLISNGIGFTRNSFCSAHERQTAVGEFYSVSRDELYRSRRGAFNEPRNVAVFLTRKLRCDGLQEIGRQLRMEKYSSISSSIERMKKKMLKDRNLKRRMDRVTEGIGKSQEQIRPEFFTNFLLTCLQFLHLPQPSQIEQKA